VIKVYAGSEAPEGASLALQHRLYINGWMLSSRLESVVEGNYRGAVAVATKDGAPVAVVLVRIARDGKSPLDIAAYCKPAYRRQGISSQLIKALEAEEVPFPNALPGIDGSQHFWRANGVKCPAY
jgi:GNAT superfamily N-acetyltransferase